MKVGYVISMKTGMSSFNRDELLELEGYGIPFVIYVTKFRKGPYMPEDRWSVRLPGIAETLLGFAHFLFSAPRRLLNVVVDTGRKRTWIEMLVALGFARDMDRSEIGWIHAHFADRKLLVARIAANLVGKPYSVTVHAHELYRTAKRIARQSALVESKRIFTVSEFNCDLLVRDWKIPRAKIEINRLVLGPSHRNLDSRPRMLVVGNFVEKKGYDVLVNALRLMEQVDLTVWIVGGGPLDVDELVHQNGLDSRIVLFGRVSEPLLSILLDACDFFCLPSHTSAVGEKEGFPMALAEAMGHSKPVLSTTHAGIPEIVPEILVPEANPAALADGIREMIARRSDWPAMGARNRAIALSYFSPVNIATLAKLFGEPVVHGGPSRDQHTGTDSIPESVRIEAR